MTKVLYIIIGNEKPSSRKRVLDSLDYLRNNGISPDIVVVPKGGHSRAALLMKLGSYDVVVIQKKLFGSAFLKLVRAANPNIVYDFDDAVMFHEVERGERITGGFFKRFIDTLSVSKGVIAGNNYLESFAQASVNDGTRVITLPTPVNIFQIAPRQKMPGKRVVVGWMGTKGNLQELTPLVPVMAEVIKDNPNAVFRVVSNADPKLDGLNYEYVRYSADTEADELASFDIGLMPLADNIWTRGKGGYKLLQYMAAGAATVSSPVGMNIEIINSRETGMHATTPDDWRRCITRLIKDEALREKMGYKGRERVIADYSLEGYNDALAGFLKSIA